MELLSHSQTSMAAAIEVWEWVSNFIPHFTGHMITYPWWNLSKFILIKGVHPQRHDG